jgi:serine/threonine protein kinase
MDTSDDWKGRILKRRYRLDERIAVGRTVEVFRGYDLVEKKEVAVKQPISFLLSDRDFCDNFRSAAHRAVRLSNPGLVEVLDYGIEEDRPFVILELIKEKTLHEMLESGRKMKAKGAMYFAIELGKTLVYLHEQGIVHGSLDEKHIFIFPGRKAKIADAGFPLVFSGAGSPYPRKMDPRRDIQDLGYVLYRLLSGRSREEAAEDVKKGKLKWRDDVPERLKGLVQQCLDSSGHGGFMSSEQMVWEAVSTLREEQPMVLVPEIRPAEEAPAGEAPVHRIALPQLKRWQIIAGVALLAAGAILLSVWILSAIIAPSKVQVPNFVNMNQENYIISQDPEGGVMVRRKTVIKVLVSLGPLEVPNLVGLSLEDARKVLESRGFRVGQIEYRQYQDFAADRVVETDPPYGSKLSEGDAVNLVVSS